MRVRAQWTGRTGLLWVLALALAGALAWWDYSTNRSPESAEPRADDSEVELEVVYGE